jgi:hypothetical protein
MYRINYPTSLSIDAYYSVLNTLNTLSIDAHLRNVITPDGSLLTLKKLVGLSFSDLLKFETCLLRYKNSVPKAKKKIKGKFVYLNPFEQLFDYKKNQPKISTFFMAQKDLEFLACHYCGIDYINSFKDIDDYKDWIDFVNRADTTELQIIKGVKAKRASQIIAKRKLKPFVTITEVTLSKTIQDEILKFDFKYQHNHFTLDHVFPQKTHKFYALCLYNFVPSCYSCNSKFKKARSFIINEHLNRVSPTSVDYALASDFKFKVYYSGSFKNIKQVSDFVLLKKIYGNKNQLEAYFRIFKIRGRYTFHKTQVLELIERKVNNSNARIRELRKLTGCSIPYLKELIFGRELFDVSIVNRPFIKLKRDIAENIKIT